MSHPHGAFPDPRLILTQMEIPGHPGLFVLGSYERNVSILAQQIRAINLVLSLESEGRLRVKKRETLRDRDANHGQSPADPGTDRTDPGRSHEAAGAAEGQPNAEIIGGPASPAADAERREKPAEPGGDRPHSRRSHEATGRAEDHASVAIIGNGVAGKTAAAMFIRCHCRATIIGPSDSSRRNPAHASRRFIHPFISDFPFASGPNADHGDAGLPVLNWSKGPAADVYESLNNEWDLLVCAEEQKAEEHQHLTCIDTTATTILPAACGGYLIELSGGSVLTADLVVMAVGLGTLPPDANYWDPGTNSTQERANKTSSWLLSGMGDSNITEFITLVFKRPDDCSAYAALIERLVALFHPPAKEDEAVKRNTGALLQECRDIENDCQYLRGDEASKELEGRYDKMLSKQPELRRLVEDLGHTIKKSLPHIVLNSKSPTVFSRDTFPLNRLALAITLACLKKKGSFGEGKVVSYHAGTAMAGGESRPGAEPSEPHSGRVVRIGSRWYTCHHFNARRLPPSPLKSIHLMGRQLDDYCREELKPRNGLDQTRHRMWPYHGNLKRIVEFGEAKIDARKSSSSGGEAGGLAPLRQWLAFTDEAGKKLVLEMCYVPTFPGRDETRAFPGYWISRYPITEKQFQVDATLQKEDVPNELPRTNVSWTEALDFCQRFGLSLPTEVQWRAAWQWPREKEGPRTFPWGDFGKKWRLFKTAPESPMVVSNIHDEAVYKSYGGRFAICPVGSYEDADGPWGTSQQFGNVLEWCLGEGRPLCDYFGVDSHRGGRPSPRLRPLGGVSSLDKEVEESLDRWPEFTWAHDETKRPDVGFRVVWMSSGPTDIRAMEDTFKEKVQEVISKTGGELRAYKKLIESRKQEMVNSFKSCGVWAFGNLRNSCHNGGSLRKAVLVLGIANQSQRFGQRIEQALAYDAYGFDWLIAGLVGRGLTLEVKFDAEVWGSNTSDVGFPADTMCVCVGGGRTNQATERVLSHFEDKKTRPAVTFLRANGNVLFDGKDHSYQPHLGALSIVSAGANAGPIVISAGVGREGTAAANAALAHLLALPHPGNGPRVQVNCPGGFDSFSGVVVRAVVPTPGRMPGEVEIYGSIEVLPESCR